MRGWKWQPTELEKELAGLWTVFLKEYVLRVDLKTLNAGTAGKEFQTMKAEEKMSAEFH